MREKEKLQRKGVIRRSEGCNRGAYICCNVCCLQREAEERAAGEAAAAAAEAARVEALQLEYEASLPDDIKEKVQAALKRELVRSACREKGGGGERGEGGDFSGQLNICRTLCKLCGRGMGLGRFKGL
jgi:predicted RNA-binding protein YlxR (DUF448 family)